MSARFDNIQQNLFKLAGRPWLMFYRRSVTGSGEQESGLPNGLRRCLLHSLKKGNLQVCQNYRTISLISNSSKVMLKIILIKLKPQAEEIIAKEQAWFRTGRSPTEQIFILESCVKSTSNSSRISTMSSLIAKKPFTEYGMQPYGPLAEV